MNDVELIKHAVEYLLGADLSYLEEEERRELGKLVKSDFKITYKSMKQKQREER